jgi:hypothetical protein
MTSRLAYGIRVDSEIPLQELPIASGNELARVQVVLDGSGSAPRRQPPTTPDVEAPVNGQLLSLTVNGGLEIRWGAILAFRVSVADSVIHCMRGPEGTLSHLQEWLLHYALPLLLQTQRRLLFLHGSAAQIGAHAVGFLARSGGGKSTVVEYFLQRGHGFLTDDKLGVAPREPGFVAVPSVPFYRRGDAKAVWKPVTNFVACPLPLHTLYVLQPAGDAASPAITRLPAREAAFALACRCELRLPARVRERLRLPSFAMERFHAAAALASTVRVCRLQVPWDQSRLPEVYDAIVADVGAA